jgi:hypothetical protein
MNPHSRQKLTRVPCLKEWPPFRHRHRVCLLRGPNQDRVVLRPSFGRSSLLSKVRLANLSSGEACPHGTVREQRAGGARPYRKALKGEGSTVGEEGIGRPVPWPNMCLEAVSRAAQDLHSSNQPLIRSCRPSGTRPKVPRLRFEAGRSQTQGSGLKKVRGHDGACVRRARGVLRLGIAPLALPFPSSLGEGVG